jgi:D-alanyl-lipoteichoic acid acyltransferase DltB (MBOAT superfamily)
MLFNSHVFILCFLPLTLLAFFTVRRAHSAHGARVVALTASLIFYGWWSIPFLLLLVLWTGGNFLAARALEGLRGEADRRGRLLLAAAVAANLCALGYFKYMTFLSGELARFTGIDLAIAAVGLPLAVSFHTFQQIAYLVDVRRGDAAHRSFVDYALFVTYFPQLIAGPIVHHRTLTPQIRSDTFGTYDGRLFAEGLAFFAIGLAKKVMLADPMSALSDPVFSSAASDPPEFVAAWVALAAFSLGLYFDFSGYSDMAIGLGRMMGVRLPYNFASPYRSSSIIDFWRRWHMTLSAFLRDYLYIPLGGNRKGPARRSVNLMITMLLGGLWHGAGWTFIVWGGLHGIYLLINHAWNERTARVRAQTGRAPAIVLGPIVSSGVTLLAVGFAWVFFASPDFAAALAMLRGLSGVEGGGLGAFLAGFSISPQLTVANSWGAAALAVGGLIVLFAPNSQEIIDRPASSSPLNAATLIRFTPNIASGIMVGVGLALGLIMASDAREFVYFQF